VSLRTYLEAAPKAELHVHLEGAILPSTLLELARRNRRSLPHDTVEGLREWFVFRDFPHFVEIYGAVSGCVRSSDDYELIAYEFGREMARQNCRYAEVTFSPFFHAYHGVPMESYVGGLLRGRDDARRDFAIDFNFVFDIIRDWGPDQAYCNDYTTRVAIECRGAGVVALGLGGFELGSAPEPYAPWFDRARAAGLRSAPHAGETDGAASVRGALDALGADRIGHGVRAVEDPSVVGELIRRRVPLEVSPTSNLRLGVYPSLAEHPLRRLHDAGVIVTVNSDDPPLFGTTLNDEVRLLDEGFGFAVEQIDQILLNAVRCSFLPDGQKQALEARFRDELAELKREHLA
jgi:aminodeoxyfutalosine deaminase